MEIHRLQQVLNILSDAEARYAINSDGSFTPFAVFAVEGRINFTTIGADFTDEERERLNYYGAEEVYEDDWVYHT